MSNINNGYPEGQDLQKQIDSRHFSGGIWRRIFFSSTIFAILVLAALLFNIIDDMAGYVAIQNELDEAELILAVEEETMLSTANTVSSEDDTELAEGIIGDPYAIGFFGYAYYADNADQLKAVSINGVAPSQETAETGAYAFTRPLFIYATDKAMQANPEVASFVNFYLTNVDNIMADVGYFSVNSEQTTKNIETWLAMMELEETTLPSVDPAGFGEEASLTIDGSSTVYPLSRQMAIDFRRAGYQGGLTIDQSGTSGGFAKFCTSKGTSINNASRPMRRSELETCQKASVGNVAEFSVGIDALAVVVSSDNDFVDNLTIEELRIIFNGQAETWSDVRPEWPQEVIQHHIPGADSGTLDFFVETVYDRGLQDLPKETLITVLELNLSPGLINRLNSETPLVERTPEDLLLLITDEIIQPRVVKSWNLFESLSSRAAIEAEVATIPNGYLDWYQWLTTDFLTSPQSSIPELSGIRTAVLGTLWIVAITMLVALPVGVAAAIYLEEYAASVKHPTLRKLNSVIQTNISNLAGVPSIIYGMLGLTVFVRVLEPLTSGSMFGVLDQNGRSILSASFTLALLILPIIIINAQEAVRAVPRSLREASMGLGATKWQTIWHHVLPTAIPGILTGNILALSRAIGETAPLIVVGASTYITFDPTSAFSGFTTLPIQIYQWTSRPQPEFQHIAAAGIVVLLCILLSLNAAAIVLRNRYSRRVS